MSHAGSGSIHNDYSESDLSPFCLVLHPSNFPAQRISPIPRFLQRSGIIPCCPETATRTIKAESTATETADPCAIRDYRSSEPALHREHKSAALRGRNCDHSILSVALTPATCAGANCKIVIWAAAP